MVDVLLLGRDHGFERLRAAVEQALDMGVSDVAAIRYLLEIERLEKRAPAEALDVGWLKRYERPQPTLQEYDSLLAVSFTEVIQ
jgi:hypothetical protein